jgi:RNA polymerase sigma-70 factor (ECF subfamily)
MGELSERSREVAVLHFLDELTQEEIGEVLGLSRKTIQRELEHIRARASALGQAAKVGHG